MSLRLYSHFCGKSLLLITGFGVSLATVPAELWGEPREANDAFLPEAVTAENFADLKSASPFRRSINLSETLVLTGIATIEGQVYATLFDSSATVSRVVTAQANKDGWRLVGVNGNDSELESLTAKIQVDGGQIVAIRYAKVEFKGQAGNRSGGTTGGRNNSGGGTLTSEQIEDARRAARDPRIGFRGDGHRGPPSPEMLSKLNKITPQKREEIARRVMEMRNRGVDSEVRLRVYNEALDRAVQGR
jgi:hypothetical protein